VARNAEGNGATQELVAQIGNADTERFASAEEVMQTLPAPPDVGYIGCCPHGPVHWGGSKRVPR
jgi:hypothetical protein